MPNSVSSKHIFLVRNYIWKLTECKKNLTYMSNHSFHTLQTPDTTQQTHTQLMVLKSKYDNMENLEQYVQLRSINFICFASM